MYIGEFARLAGTTPKAIRLYEQLGLLPEPRRRGKYRVYRTEVTVHRDGVDSTNSSGNG